MARIICLFVLIFSTFATLAVGDEQFEVYKRRLRSAHAKISPSCPDHLIDTLAKFARAIRHHDALFVRGFLGHTEPRTLALALDGPYEFPKREKLNPVSALQLAVFSQSKEIVKLLLEFYGQRPYLAHVSDLTSALHMAAYLDDADAVYEFIALTKQHPDFATILGADNSLKATPLETALKYKRFKAATCLVSQFLGLPLVYSSTFLALVTNLWHQKTNDFI